MAWRPVRFPAVLDGSDLSLKVIAGLGAGARHIDGIVLAFRRSFEAGIFFDRERAMENVAFDQGCTVQLDARCMDRTLCAPNDPPACPAWGRVGMRTPYSFAPANDRKRMDLENRC